MYAKVLFLVATALQTVFSANDPLVKLPNGQIRGSQPVTMEGKSYYAFKGIPYAAPPTGSLRFKAPQPAPNWDGVRDATNLRIGCFQLEGNSDNESEDCLFINVATPKLPSEDHNVSLPVMLYIHGGGFIDGSSKSIPPDLFINNDVILASINYRLGVFGFLSTQDEVIPGNNGLKDQHLAIQWLHDNVHLFGGDPNKITIFGQSAGSASCAYQLLNQKSKGLFRATILESGSFLSPWAFQRRAREIAFATASFLNSTFKTNNDSQALFEFLQDVKARDLDKAAEQLRRSRKDPGDIQILQGYQYAPVVEVENPDAFFTEKMFKMLKAGNVVAVPTLMGVTSEENLSFNTNPNGFKATIKKFDEKLSLLVPNDMQIANETARTEMGRLIRQLYTGGKPLADNLGAACRYTSDTSFTRSVIKHAELYSRLAPTYFYVFSYDGKLANFNVHYDGAESVAHNEELAYLFCSGNNCKDSGFPEADQITRKRLIKIWTNFAKYLNPTPEKSELLQKIIWPLVSVHTIDFRYVDINENLKIKNFPKRETYAGWTNLYQSLHHCDFDTY